MLSLPIGMLFILSVIYFSLPSSGLEVYINGHSFVIVVTGTIAILVLSTPVSGLKSLSGALLKLWKAKFNEKQMNDLLQEMVQNKKSKSSHLNPLAKQAQDLWEQGVDPKLIEHMLELTMEQFVKNLQEPVSLMRSLSKYPPALGMLGTVMGMVSLFANLSAENRSNIGENLAIAMTATLYGLVLANALITPLADRLSAQFQREVKFNETLLHALIMVNRDEPIAVIENISSNIEKKVS